MTIPTNELEKTAAEDNEQKNQVGRGIEHHAINYM